MPFSVVVVFVFCFLKSYISQRKQKVFVAEHYSPESCVEVGVPRGSVPGPLHFSIYIHDLPLSISSTEVDCDMFADDSSVSASGNNIAAINAKLPAKHPRSNRIVFRECNVAQPREN